VPTALYHGKIDINKKYAKILPKKLFLIIKNSKEITCRETSYLFKDLMTKGGMCCNPAEEIPSCLI
jgi:hypothetical protein